ncbi:MAG: hypothetical protein DRN68_02190 [Thaumarchaeota archaeon]|nr:MAG: hypothetical protein DRN68_02190 [Nitrososphaerota archaeon]
MPQLKVKAGSTVILYGPASALLISGKASILDHQLKLKKRVVVKSWRSRPIYVEDDSVIECIHGEGGGFEVLDVDTVPVEWRKIVEELNSWKGLIAVYGGVDSGKTSLATLIANNLVKLYGVSAYIDLDLGQSNICPPTTIGYVKLKRTVPDISTLRMDCGEVVGYTSPTPLVEKHVKEAEKLIKKLRDEGIETCVTDLDGWVSGSQAIEHKLMLFKILKPKLILSIGSLPSELRSLCEDIGAEVRELPPPLRVRKREPSARRRLRSMAYSRFLRNSILRKIPISWARVEDLMGVGDVQEISSKIMKLVSTYIEENDLIIDLKDLKALEELSKKGVGILSYLYDLGDSFSGIGLLMAFNAKKNYLKIYTPFKQQVKRMVIGSILLSADGEELYTIPPNML